ncbi:DUF2851 family protein [Persicirhabdus sediminis]|uniref:DUF2851 family protein n=1 Tax=Persicirhabdus sediminis TaxID=454144 RepID=A0A8J7MFP5_9BACT|nr:DUF2851 family protein [Persicirhabdus sediminis]MBK1791917.1 DUF2851 family protein [Persicirhabdus sediminis]
MYLDFLQQRKCQLAGSQVDEPAQQHNWDGELELQSQWFAGAFGREFTTTEGKTVKIIQFGQWNHGAGPDFLHAAVQVDDQLLHGAIEIDLGAENWQLHGHQKNPAFDSVVLHLVFTESQLTSFCQNSQNQFIHRVQISPHAQLDSPPLKLPSHASYLPGRCQAPLLELSASQIDQLMREAFYHRCQLKGQKIRRQIDIQGHDEWLWQAIARTLGYQQNKLAFTVLAQRLPIKQLSNQPALAEAILFGVAGLLPHHIEQNAPADGKSYLQLLWNDWWQIRQNFSFAGQNKIPWQWHGSRPANHPQRRLGALAAIAKNWRQLEKANATLCIEQLGHLTHKFWNHHYTLKSKPTAKSMRLVGDSKLQDLFINHLYPLSHSLSKQPLPQLKRSSLNSQCKNAAARLFGTRLDAKQFTQHLWQQQALQQIFEDFCLVDHSDCHNCPLPELIRMQMGT